MGGDAKQDREMMQEGKEWKSRRGRKKEGRARGKKNIERKRDEGKDREE